MSRGSSAQRSSTVDEQTARFVNAKAELLKSHANLTDLADYCDDQYEEAETDEAKRQLFELSKTYAIQALGSLAYQINESSTSVLGMLDIVSGSCQSVLSDVSQIILIVEVHREKVAKREAASVCKPKPEIKRHKKVVAPTHMDIPIYPGHKALNRALLDGVGCGARRADKDHSPHGSTADDILLCGDTLTNIASSSLHPSRTEGGVRRMDDRVRRDSIGLVNVVSPCLPSRQGPRESMPVGLSPCPATPQRPRSASLNDIASAEQRLVQEGTPGHGGADTYDSFDATTAAALSASRRATTVGRPAAASPGLRPQSGAHRRRSTSMGDVTSDIYSNWPQIRKEELRRMASGPKPLPPANPPPPSPLPSPPLPDDAYMNFGRHMSVSGRQDQQDRRASVSSQRALPVAGDDDDDGDEYINVSHRASMSGRRDQSRHASISSQHVAAAGTATAHDAAESDVPIEYESVVYDMVRPVEDAFSLSPSPASSRTGGRSLDATPLPQSAQDAAQIAYEVPGVDIWPGTPTVEEALPAGYLASAEVLYDFEPAGSSQLGVRQGETVYVVDASHDQWCTAVNQAGTRGFVPCSYVRMAEQ